MSDISPARLNLLRAGYLLLVVGLGLIIWPSILVPPENWDRSRSIVVSMLGSLSLLSLIGLRHPLRMLPLLFWEFTWKAIWLLRVALPAWLKGPLDAGMAQTAFECVSVVVIVAVVPWDYVFRTYVQAAGDPWRRRAA